MGYISSPGFSLASGSPELLVKLDGDVVSARPIAGTRRRGSSPEEDEAMEAERWRERTGGAYYAGRSGA